MFIASTDGDNTNLIIAQIAQKRFSVQKVLARVMDPARAAWYGEQGLHTISPTQHAIDMFEQALESSSELDVRDHRRRRQGRAQPRTRADREGPRGHAAGVLAPALPRRSRRSSSTPSQYGDATELWVLERAGIQRADLVIAVTGDDEDNMLVCQVAKEKYLCDRMIARVNNPRNHEHFKLLGIQPAVSATDLILRLIEHEVPRYGLVHLLALEEERLEIIELEVADDAPVIGERVADIELPEGSLIISVLRAGARLRAERRHRHRGRRPGPPRARPGPRGPDHPVLRAGERGGEGGIARAGRGCDVAPAGPSTILKPAFRDGVIGNTRASGARIWGSSPCPGVHFAPRVHRGFVGGPLPL